MNISRRSFLKSGGIAALAVPFFGAIMGRVSAHAAVADMPALKADDAMAKSLGFCLNADKPTKQCSDRKAADKKGQYCSGCQLYTKAKGEGKSEMGKCILMTKGLVPNHGWCKSWVKRPA